MRPARPAWGESRDHKVARFRSTEWRPDKANNACFNCRLSTENAGSMLVTAPPKEADYSQVREVIMFHISSLLKNSILTATVCFAATSAMAQGTGQPTDPQIAHIAYNGWADRH